jgi:hypothetical protein
MFSLLGVGVEAGWLAGELPLEAPDGDPFPSPGTVMPKIWAWLGADVASTARAIPRNRHRI